MCGISGIFDPHGSLPQDARARCDTMNRAMVHRGPDGGGIEAAGNGVLGHRRLSIIDLEGGVQPMPSADGGLCLAFNGEIYNFQSLRAELEAKGHAFRTRSDTEVLLEGYRAWGEGVVDRLRGMFAFVLHDRAKNLVFGARDPIGKKPLFLRMAGTTLYFCSEPGSLVACGAADGSISAEAAHIYFSLGYVPAPHCIYAGVTKLGAGRAFRYSAGGMREWTYWDLPAAREDLSDGEALDRLRGHLDGAVSRRMVSDVPLGAFLSGGVDSNLVVSSMARQSRLPVRTFCAGFGEKAALAGVRDERELAAEAARAYGAEHEEIRLDASSAEGLLPELARRMQEPLADPSCIPTYLICQAARKRVTVALTGDGGDEPFGGYSFRYLPFLLERRIRAAVPGALSAMGAPAAPALRMLAGLWPHGDGLPRFLRLKTLFRNLGSDPVAAFYLDQSLLGLGQEALAPPLRKAGNPALEHMRALHGGYHASDPLTRMLYVDARLYMCENVLVKADRMSMANSLELRSPLLDQDLVAFAFSLPDRFKIRDGECKYLLRRLAAERTPPRLLEQPKTGFSLPYDAYLRKQWRPCFERTVFSASSPCEEWLDMDRVKRHWEAFLGGRNAPLRFLWAVFTFALWRTEGIASMRQATPRSAIGTGSAFS